MSDKNRITIFDTTMRDGEQSPGATMSLEEKIQIARCFDELGIDVIEAGFPIASPGDFEAVTEISKVLKKSIPAGLSRATKKDIDACKDSLKHAKRFRIHTFISTSPLHMKHKLNKSPEEVLGLIKESVTYASKFTDDVEWSCEDGTRTDLDFMCKSVELAIKCGAKTINIPDTVGYSALEEVVMAMRTRNDLMPYTTGINTKLLSKASKIVSNATGFPVQFNKAVVGKNAFAHESGIHQDGMLKNRNTYEIMTPESVGVKKTSLVMGKHSGRHAFRDKLSDMGYVDVTDDIIDIAFGKFKILADKKKHVYDEDIAALVDDSLIKDDNLIKLKSLKVYAGTGEPQKAVMKLEVMGDVKEATESGDGPVDAIFKCIKTLYPHDVNLQLYNVHAVTEGTDAQATVSVRIEENGKTTVGQAANTDTLVASADAYLNALNKLIIKRKKTAPEPMDLSGSKYIREKDGTI